MPSSGSASPAPTLRPSSHGAGSAGASSAMVKGSLSFATVSLLAYSIWAFHLIPGTAGLYATTAAIYIGLAGLALSRLIDAPEAWKRFPFLFALAFLLYAVAWCAFYFGLRGKFHADLWGAATGLAAMTWLIRRYFGSSANFVSLFGVLFAMHTLGYTLGDVLYAVVRDTPGRLLWGAAHGLGFGAGLGYVIYHCQHSEQNRVTSARSEASSGATTTYN